MRIRAAGRKIAEAASRRAVRSGDALGVVAITGAIRYLGKMIVDGRTCPPCGAAARRSRAVRG
jgi:hypothetical protein